LLPEPQRNGLGERGESAGGEGQVGLQEALELEEWLVVKHDVVHLRETASSVAEAIFDRMAWEAGVVLLPWEPLLLSCRHAASVRHERGGAVVIERRDAEDAHATTPQNSV